MSRELSIVKVFSHATDDLLQFHFPTLRLMYKPGSPFEIIYKDSTLTVQEFTIAEGNIFRILFPDDTPQLVITRTSGPDGKGWAPVPEGREEEATEIGKKVLEVLTKN